MTVGISFAVGTLIMNTIAHFLISNSGGSNRNFYLLGLGLFFYGVGFVFWVLALWRIPIYIAYPVLALGIILIPLIESRLQGIELSFTTWVILAWILSGFIALIWESRSPL